KPRQLDVLDILPSRRFDPDHEPFDDEHHAGRDALPFVWRVTQRLARTVIPTGLLVVTAPPLSVARTVRTWFPGGTFLHVKAEGALVSWRSPVAPSWTSTFVTLPPGSLAVAVIVIVGFQAKVAPSAGEVM